MDSYFLDQIASALVPSFKVVAATSLSLLTTVSAGLFQDTVRFCNLNEALAPSLAFVSALNILFLAHTIR